MSAFILKLIAIITMTIDHIGAVFPTDTPFFFRVIGRAAFPIFTFLIAEGCTHTRSIVRYMRNLAIFAVIAEIPFDLAFNMSSLESFRLDFLGRTNVFYTLFLGVLCVFVYKTLMEKKLPKLLAMLIPFPLIFLAEFLGTDYGATGVALIYFMYCAETKVKRLIVLLAGVIFLYGLSAVNRGTIYIQFFISALMAFGLTCLYNGKRGPKLKWAFYIFYPAHLLILVFIKQFLY